MQSSQPIAPIALSTSDRERLLRMFQHYRPRGAAPEDTAKVIAWAQRVRHQQEQLERVLTGELKIIGPAHSGGLVLCPTDAGDPEPPDWTLPVTMADIVECLEWN